MTDCLRIGNGKGGEQGSYSQHKVGDVVIWQPDPHDNPPYSNGIAYYSEKLEFWEYPDNLARLKQYLGLDGYNEQDADRLWSILGNKCIETFDLDVWLLSQETKEALTEQEQNKIFNLGIF